MSPPLQPRDAWKWWLQLVALVEERTAPDERPLSDETVFDRVKTQLQLVVSSEEFDELGRSFVMEVRRHLSEVGIERTFVDDAAAAEIRQLRDRNATLEGLVAARASEADVTADVTADVVDVLRDPPPPSPGLVELMSREPVPAAGSSPDAAEKGYQTRKLRERVAELEGLLARIGIGTPGGEGGEPEHWADGSRSEPPIPMVLFCPACGRQHVDMANPAEGWDNPSHRSHKCGACSHVWRPADVPTAGVETIATVGQVDTDPPIRNRVRAVTTSGLVHVTDDELLKEDLAELWDRRKADRTFGSAEQRLKRVSGALANAGCEPGDIEWMLLQAGGAIGYRRAREPQLFIRDELRKLEKAGQGVSDVLVRYSDEDKCFIGRLGSIQAHGPTVESALVELCVAVSLAGMYPRVNEGTDSAGETLPNQTKDSQDDPTKEDR